MRWHLRQFMATRGIFQTSELVASYPQRAQATAATTADTRIHTEPPISAISSIVTPARCGSSNRVP